jgi:O-antigen ligase
MNEPVTYLEYEEPFYSESKQRVPFFCFLFIPFIMAAISVASLEGYAQYTKLYGIICAIFFLIGTIRSGIKFPAECLLYAAFLAWTLLGIFGVKNPLLYVIGLTTLVQIVGMFIIIANISVNEKATRFLMWGFLMGCGIVAVSGYVTGQFQAAELQEGERVAGLALNANLFSMIMVLASMFVLFLFRYYKSLVLKSGFIAVFVILSLLILASGSRAGFISFGLFVVIWFFLTYRKEMFQKPATALVMVIGFIGFSVFMIYKMQDSALFQRFLQAGFALSGDTEGDSSTVERMHLIRTGIGMIIDKPLFGSGVQGFAAEYGRYYSHCNYIEIFVAGGIPGGLLYYSIFVVLWLRTVRLKRYLIESRDIDMLYLIRTFIIVRLVSDVVTVNYNMKVDWILIAILAGWAYHKDHEIKQQEMWYQQPEEEYCQQDEYYQQDQCDQQDDFQAKDK